MTRIFTEIPEFYFSPVAQFLLSGWQASLPSNQCVIVQPVVFCIYLFVLNISCSKHSPAFIQTKPVSTRSLLLVCCWDCAEMLGQSVKIGKHLTGVHVGTDTSHLVMMVDDDTDIMENGYCHNSITLFQSLTDNLLKSRLVECSAICQ